MSKPVKQLVQNELVKRFGNIDSLAVVGFTGLDAIMTHTVRGRLLDKGVRMMVVKNSVARQAFKKLGIEKAGEMLDGPCAVAYGTDPKVSVVNVVRSLLEIAKDAPKLTVKAALLEGEIFGKDRIEELSKYPTRDESLSQLVGLLLSPGRKLAACLIGPGSKVAAILKTIEDKRKEEADAAPKAEAPVAAEAAAPAPLVEAPAPAAPAATPPAPEAKA
jgi:ribosomal protein L10